MKLFFGQQFNSIGTNLPLKLTVMMILFDLGSDKWNLFTSRSSVMGKVVALLSLLRAVD